MRLTPAFRLIGLGSYVATCIVGGTVGGYYLDRILGTGDWFTLGGLALGLVAALWGGYRMLMETLADVRRWQAREAKRDRGGR